MNCSCVFVDLSKATFGDVVRRTTNEMEAVILLTCCECQKTIQIGEMFRREKTELLNSRTFTRTTCMDCISIRDTFFCEGWYYGEIHKSLREHISKVDGEIPEECIAILTPKAREAVCKMIEQYWNTWVCPSEAQHFYCDRF